MAKEAGLETSAMQCREIASDIASVSFNKDARRGAGLRLKPASSWAMGLTAVGGRPVGSPPRLGRAVQNTIMLIQDNVNFEFSFSLFREEYS